MGLKAGALLWNRQRITLTAGTNNIDTGLTQVGRGFENMSKGEPPLGTSSAPPGPVPGTLPASRIQVIPMAPTAAWALVTHGEPFVNPATNTIWVSFSNGNETPVEINVLLWDPHSIVGPGEADTYIAAD